VLLIYWNGVCDPLGVEDDILIAIFLQNNMIFGHIVCICSVVVVKSERTRWL
jgi:hypothetical protein